MLKTQIPWPHRAAGSESQRLGRTLDFLLTASFTLPALTRAAANTAVCVRKPTDPALPKAVARWSMDPRSRTVHIETAQGHILAEHGKQASPTGQGYLNIFEISLLDPARPKPPHWAVRDSAHDQHAVTSFWRNLEDYALHHPDSMNLNPQAIENADLDRNRSTSAADETDQPITEERVGDSPHPTSQLIKCLADAVEQKEPKLRLLPSLDPISTGSFRIPTSEGTLWLHQAQSFHMRVTELDLQPRTRARFIDELNKRS